VTPNLVIDATTPGRNKTLYQPSCGNQYLTLKNMASPTSVTEIKTLSAQYNTKPLKILLTAIIKFMRQYNPGLAPLKAVCLSPIIKRTNGICPLFANRIQARPGSF